MVVFRYSNDPDPCWRLDQCAAFRVVYRVFPIATILLCSVLLSPICENRSAYSRDSRRAATDPPGKPVWERGKNRRFKVQVRLM